MIPRTAAASAQAWWQAMQPGTDGRHPGDRAALARLRRCASVSEAMQDNAALGLFRRAQATHPDDLPGLGLAAAVLAHVRQDAPGTVARLVGPDSLDTPETALLKPLRFRRLMEADGPDERLAAFRRLAALAGGTLPVRDLAEGLLDWSERRRTRWVLDYWHVASGPAGGPAPPEKEARLGSPSAAHSNGPNGTSEPLGSSAQTRKGFEDPLIP